MKYLYILFLLLISTISASAQTEIPLSSLSYTSDGSSITITSCNTSVSGDVSIPDTIEGLPVTWLGEKAFIGCSQITKLTIPEGVIVIDVKCFFNCWNIQEFVLPSTLKAFGYQAFRTCRSMESITFPSQIKTIPDFLFLGCTSLKTVNIHSGITTIGRNAFDECTALEYLTIPGSVKSIPSQCFVDCTALISVTFGEGVESINNSAFTNCTSLSSIHIPASLTNIGTSLKSAANLEYITAEASSTTYQAVDNVLYNKDLTQLVAVPRGRSGSYTIPDSVTSIISGSISNCSLLTELTIGTGLLSMDGSELNGCSALTSVLVAAGHTTLASDGTSVTDNTLATLYFIAPGYSGAYVLAPNITSLADYALNNRDLLTSFTANHNLDSIGIGALAYCDQLTTISLFGSVNSLSSECFRNNSSLSLINFPNNITELPASALQSCTQLTQVSLPDSLITVGDNAFSGCTALQTVNLDKLTSIGNSAFKNCQTLTSVTFNTATITFGTNAFENCDGITSLTIPNATIIPSNCFSSMDALETLVLPDNLVELGDYSFSYCSLLSSVTFGSQLEVIGSEALAYCALTSVTLPEGVQTIGSYAFGENYYLTHVDLPSSLTSLGGESFYECPELLSVLFRGNAPALDDESNFTDCHPDLILYYFEGATGFDSTYDEIPTQAINLSTTPYAVWSISQGLSHDQDLDEKHPSTGVAYLMLYALDLPCQSATAADLPQFSMQDDEMQLTFSTPRNDISYIIEYSTDLTIWNTSGVTFTSTGEADDYIAHIPASDNQRFVRLRVTTATLD